VTETGEEGAQLEVNHTGPKGARIRSDKGINFPDTELSLPALTPKDLEDLDFVCAHADIIGFSFVRKLDDIDILRRELAARGKPELPIVLKIETAAAVRNLPDLLLGTLGQHALGVMIARGDLAVELGSVRMAEIQEEILWICEAARIPVIWATQVLDTLAHKGAIARPEITDAAMSVRAECVMLNKGNYITEAVGVLNNILTRMDAHQYKKVSRLRRLHW
ncbi:MAG: pyruvate kinase, partial [Gammaproteobacteria bacterium]